MSLRSTIVLRASLVAFAAIAISAFVLVLAPVAVDASPLDQPFTPHPTLVPEIPETGYPIILTTPANGVNGNRQTRAVDLIGDYIVSGGDFHNIELQNGQIIEQRYLAIFDVSTKQLVCTNLDLNNDVLAIAPGLDRNTAIIAGRFTTVNGADGVTRTKPRVAKVDLDTCQVDPNWTAGPINSKVTELAVNGNRLFVGGDFTAIGGTTIERLAELDRSTGAINPNFSFVFGGELSSPISGLEVNAAGTRVAIVHRTTSINGNSMRGTAIFNVSNPNAPTLTNHRMSTGANAYANYNKIQDGAVSPDFSRIAIAAGFSTAADYVTLVPTTEVAGQLSWQHFMRDTNTGIAISNNAVYVGGHFCKPDGGPGSALMAPNSGPSSCTGSVNIAGGVWRTQLAALRISDGAPLNWNPGNDAFRGVTAVTVVSRGLLIGYDGDRVNNRRVGSTGFFDFGGTPDPRENQTCTAAVDANFDVNLTWTAVPGGVDGDNYEVRRDGAFVANAGNTTTYTDSPDNGTYTYRIRSDLNGVEWDTTCEPSVTVDAPPPAAQTCSATEANGLVTLTWTSIAGENNYIVRRNNSYVATAGNTLTYDDSPGNGTFTYVIRSNMAGVQTNTTCNPTITIDDGPPPGGQTCTATEANGLVTLDWTAIAGENNYIVRRNNSWIATAGNTLTYDDTPGNGTFTYVIRSNMAGVQTNTTCNPTITIDDGPPPGGQTCTATTNGNGSITLDWTAIAGENNYIVRRNGAWLTTAGNTLTYTDNAADPGDTYIIRSNMGGVQTNTTCD